MISLMKGDELFLGNDFYVIKKGKIISKNILRTGRVIIDEDCIKQGEMIGNFFLLLEEKKENFFDNEVEIEALEDNTVLEKINIPLKKIYEDRYFQKILIQLYKKLITKFFYQLYNTEGYILSVLKLYVDNKGAIDKEEISYKNFNISKTHFYRVYQSLKDKKLILEKNNKIYLNIVKTDKYLEKLSEK